MKAPDKIYIYEWEEVHAGHRVTGDAWECLGTTNERQAKKWSNEKEIEYIRKDLHDAKIFERQFIDAMRTPRVKELETEIERLREAMQWFCDRVEKGEVRSRRTYARFKDLLNQEMEIGDIRIFNREITHEERQKIYKERGKDA